MRKLANLSSTIICVTGLVILSAVAAQSQGLNPSTSGALLTINGTVFSGANSTPVNVSISDKDIVAATNQPPVGPGGASTCTAADEVPTAGYVLQAAAATGCDPGDTFEGTILDGSATLSSTSGAVAYTFNIKTHYQCGSNGGGSCNFEATMTNTNGNIISGDTGFLTVTNNGADGTYFLGTITLEGTPGPSAAGLSAAGCTAGQPLTDTLTFTQIDPPFSAGQSVILALASDSSGCGGFSSMTSYTTPPQTTSQGGSNSFTDPGGSGTVQTYVFPANTTFQNGNNSCSSPTMAIQFQYWDPALFNSSRLPGVPQIPNWCSSSGLECTTPVPVGTACAQLSVNGNSCIVEEAQCSCGGTQIPQCNVTGTSGPILVSNANNNYASPKPTNPGLVIGDDGQNNWAIMPQAPDGATCTTNCSTQKLNTDITILDVNQPDFSFTAAPSTLNIGVGGLGTSTVTLSALYGFTGSVALLVTNAPAGVTTTFSPAPVTPPSSPSSTPSTLTVSVGPNVMPTSFTLDVSGNNSTPPPTLTHYAFVTVNVVANTSSITNLIGTLLSNGCIDNAGIANALTSKLSAAQAFINAGGNLDAINTLTAFKNQTSAQSGKHIHSSCTIGGVTFNAATVLISDAQGLINSLRLGTISDPITGYVLNSSGAGVQGATVSIVSDATTLTATTDVTGFYYFAMTNLLTSGSTYSIQVVSPFPTPYTTSVPAYSTFTWTTVGFNSNFTLN